MKKSDLSNVRTFALGGGEWSIEVYNREGQCVREFCGLNGTQNGEEADDLWALYQEWYDSLPD